MAAPQHRHKPGSLTMHSCDVFVRTGISFSDAQAALKHIGKEMLRAGVVQVSYPHALIRREAEFPTGIMLENHAVAIPHCEAVHALKPAIYLIRPDEAVLFSQADGDEPVQALLIIALIVTHPSEQLVLLRNLFGQLQDSLFIEQLLAAPEQQLADIFKQQVFPTLINKSDPTTPKTTISKTEHRGALS